MKNDLAALKAAWESAEEEYKALQAAQDTAESWLIAATEEQSEIVDSLNAARVATYSAQRAHEAAVRKTNETGRTLNHALTDYLRALCEEMEAKL